MSANKNVALRNAGMERKREKKIYKLEPPVCPICHKVNLLGSLYCSDCLHPLTEEALEEVQTTSQMIHQLFVGKPKALAMFQELVQELKNQSS